MRFTCEVLKIESQKLHIGIFEFHCIGSGTYIELETGNIRKIIPLCMENFVVEIVIQNKTLGSRKTPTFTSPALIFIISEYST